MSDEWIEQKKMASKVITTMAEQTKNRTTYRNFRKSKGIKKSTAHTVFFLSTVGCLLFEIAYVSCVGTHWKSSHTHEVEKT